VITVSADPAAVARPSLAPSFLALALGLIILAYGMIAQDPPGPSAVWNGVVDSALAFPSAVPGLVAGRTPTRGVTLYFRKGAGARTLRMPPAFATLADAFHPGDTVRALLGWGGRQDTAMALAVTRNGAILLDSGVVLAAERRRSNRTGLLGTVIGVLGAISLFRRSRVRRAMPVTQG
jgi:hypothetical protein